MCPGECIGTLNDPGCFTDPARCWSMFTEPVSQIKCQSVGDGSRVVTGQSMRRTSPGNLKTLWIELEPNVEQGKFERKKRVVAKDEQMKNQANSHRYWGGARGGAERWSMHLFLDVGLVSSAEANLTTDQRRSFFARTRSLSITKQTRP